MRSDVRDVGVGVPAFSGLTVLRNFQTLTQCLGEQRAGDKAGTAPAKPQIDNRTIRLAPP